MDPLDAPTFDPDQTRHPEELGRLPEALFGEFGKYHIVEKIGQGGMGAVYRALDTVLGREVAIKVPIFDAVDRQAALGRFRREAIAAATLRHPVICPIFEYNEQYGIPFIVTPYLRGRSLQSQLDESGPWPLEPALQLGIKLANALYFAHQSKVIHRDIKPQNIFLELDGAPMILDFGLAKFAVPRDDQRTQSGDILGTPAYMPPEQIDPSLGSIGPAADIYSLGMTLFYVLTGRTAFSADPACAVPQILLDPPPLASRVGPAGNSLSCIDLVLNQALAKQPNQRFESMFEFAAVMQKVLDGGQWRTSATIQLPDLGIVGTGHRYHPLAGQRHIRIGRQRAATNNPTLPTNDLVVRADGDADKSLKISRQHLEIVSTENGFAAIDRSLAGISINGIRASKGVPVPLQFGDIIQVAGVIEIVVLRPTVGLAGGESLAGFEATMGDFYRDGDAC
jgi:serine/threonine protein kinase